MHGSRSLARLSFSLFSLFYFKSPFPFKGIVEKLVNKTDSMQSNSSYMRSTCTS